MHLTRESSVKAACIGLALLYCASTAFAQMYRWVDKDGKTRYSDTPPTGVKAARLGAPASGSAAAVPAESAKDAKKGPLTPAETEQGFRKRQEAARKDQEKSEQERQAQAEKAENCALAREQQRALESGRVARTNAAGERYYLDENQIAQEQAKTQKAIQQVCAN